MEKSFKKESGQMKKLGNRQGQTEYVLALGVFLILCFFLARYTVYTLDSDVSGGPPSYGELALRLRTEGVLQSADIHSSVFPL